MLHLSGGMSQIGWGLSYQSVAMLMVVALITFWAIRPRELEGDRGQGTGRGEPACNNKRTAIDHAADLPREKIERVRALMEQHIPDATVEDFDTLVGQLNLPDDGDRHVLAAAIKGDSAILVFGHFRHFPARARLPYDRHR